MRKKLAGFTLVELLVVVSIIAILATIAISAYSNVQKSGRDAKRQSNLENIKSVLEQYHADQNYYPQTANLNLSTSTSITDPGGQRRYLSKVPKDPTGTVNYLYQALPIDCNNLSPALNPSNKYCTSYFLCAKVESLSRATTLSNCDSDIYNYEVTAP